VRCSSEVYWIVYKINEIRQGENTIYIQDSLAGPSGSRATISLFLTKGSPHVTLPSEPSSLETLSGFSNLNLQTLPIPFAFHTVTEHIFIG